MTDIFFEWDFKSETKHASTQGTYSPEDWGVWTKENNTIIKIDKEKVHNYIHIYYYPFGCQDLEYIAFTVASGSFSKTIISKKRNYFNNIEKILIPVDENSIYNSEVVITIKIHNPASPKNYQINQDSRKLGLALKRLVCAPLDYDPSIPNNIIKNSYFIREEMDTHSYNSKIPPSVYFLCNEITNLSNKNNLGIFISSGSLLGAVRHQGMIPWDDDVDFCILEENSENFFKLAQEHFNNTGWTIRRQNEPWTGFQIIHKNNDISDSPMAYADIFILKEEKGEVFCKAGFLKFTPLKADIFPLRQKKFGSSIANIPSNYKKILFQEFGEDCLETPSVFNHNYRFSLVKKEGKEEKLEFKPAGPFLHPY